VKTPEKWLKQNTNKKVLELCKKLNISEKGLLASLYSVGRCNSKLRPAVEEALRVREEEGPDEENEDARWLAHQYFTHQKESVKVANRNGYEKSNAVRGIVEAFSESDETAKTIQETLEMAFRDLIEHWEEQQEKTRDAVALQEETRGPQREPPGLPAAQPHKHRLSEFQCRHCDSGEPVNVQVANYIASMAVTHYKSMEYTEYLQTEHWKRFRDSYKKNHSECELCSSTAQLQLHHKNYKNLGRETFDDVTLLCGSCHAHFHGR